MANLRFEHINKIYPNGVQAVFDFNLAIKDKEFVVFVGPSGCGKSTTLRMVAGLEEITSGKLFIDDKLVNTVMPKDRDISMVFQNYALYPHLTNFENMAFGLKIRKIPKEIKDKGGNPIYVIDKERIKELRNEIRLLKEEKGNESLISQKEEEINKLLSSPSKKKVKMVHMDKASISKRVNEVAEILGLTQYLKRKPGALSGGQRQRVALGRAIVRNPRVFLMDEPLSNLDAKLRVQMRKEIIHIHRQVGATTIYVTHDQTEAMTMADRIVIMKDGYIQQIGTPKEVYNDPNNVFVGGFVGSPAMNFYTGLIKNDCFVFDNSSESIDIDIDQYPFIPSYEGKQIILGVRPEHSHIEGSVNNLNPTKPFKVKVSMIELLGSDSIAYGEIEGQNFSSKVSSELNIKSDETYSFCFDQRKLYFFDKETNVRIR